MVLAVCWVASLCKIFPADFFSHVIADAHDVEGSTAPTASSPGFLGIVQ
jgi:hypothetical protein